MVRSKGGRPPMEERELDRRRRFGAIVRSLRGAEKQEPFAQRIGESAHRPSWTQAKLCKIEKGRVPLTLELIEDVAYANGLSVGWMMLRVYSMPLTPDNPYPPGSDAGAPPMFSSDEEFQHALQTSFFAAMGFAISQKSVELTGRLAHPDVTATITAMIDLSKDDKQTVRGLADQLMRRQDARRQAHSNAVRPQQDPAGRPV